MKNLTLFLLFCLHLGLTFSSHAAQYPARYDEHINDFARVIDVDTKSAIIQRLNFHLTHSGHHLQIVTLKNFQFYANENEDWQRFTKRFFAQWPSTVQPNENTALVLFDMKTNQLSIQFSSKYPSHYQNLASQLTQEQTNALQQGHEFNTLLLGITDRFIEVTLSPVTFFQWHKWKFLAGCYLLLSLCIAIAIRNNQRAPLMLLLFGVCGVLIIAVFRSLLPQNGFAKS